MKVAALAALIVLIALPAEAGQRHRQNGSPATTCDNNGHCTTFNASAPVPRLRGSRLKIHDKTIDAAATPPGPGTATAATPAAAWHCHRNGDSNSCHFWHCHGHNDSGCS